MEEALRGLIVFLPLGYAWFVLINHLRIEWTLNPQYTYGWAVPFLCAYLIWEGRRGGKPKTGNRKPEFSEPDGTDTCLLPPASCPEKPPHPNLLPPGEKERPFVRRPKLSFLLSVFPPPPTHPPP